MKGKETKPNLTSEPIPYEKKIPFVSNLFKNRIKTSIKFAELKKDSIILDVGSRDGYLLKTIRNFNTSCKCYGIEKNPDELKKIETCDIRVADVMQMPFEKEFFDVVFALDVLEHINDIEKSINEIRRVLKPEGVFIISGPTESWFYKFCRLLFRHKLEYDEHVHTIYGIEKKIKTDDFQLVNRKSLPGFPIPELFRISEFKKK